MELVLQASFTAAVITALILMANLFGEYFAGLVAGLPFSTVPALLLVGVGRGTAAAADAAAGAVVGCTLASLFALAYFAGSRRFSPLRAGACVVAVLAVGVALLGSVSLSLTTAGALIVAGAAVVSIVVRGLPHQPRPAEPRKFRHQAAWALAAGAVGAAAVALVDLLSPSFAGLVTAMPIIGVASVICRHATHGAAAVPPFLRAYVLSSVAKAVFCAAFAVCVAHGGISIALLVAGALGTTVCLLPRLAPRRHLQRRAPVFS